MPRIRKVSPEEAASWPDEPDDLPDYSPPTPAEIEALLARYAGRDRRGLTRLDRPTRTGHGGDHAWRGRVWYGAAERHRQFSDRQHGGPGHALQAAIAWRDATRAEVSTPRRQRPGVRWRITRCEYERAAGYLAYADRRKFFSAAKHGGWGGAKEAAEAWLLSRYTGE